MTESEIVCDLELVVDRLLELCEWDCSKKLERIKNYILEESCPREPAVTLKSFSTNRPEMRLLKSI